MARNFLLLLSILSVMLVFGPRGARAASSYVTATDLTAATGQRISDTPVGWSPVAGTERLAAMTPAGRLVVFTLRDGASPSCQVFGSAMAAKVTAVDSARRIAQIEAAIGEKIAATPTKVSWSAVYLTRIAKREVVSPASAWNDATGLHLVAQAAGGELISLSSVGATNWNTISISKLTNERIAGAPAATLDNGNKPGFIPLVAARALNGSLLLFWRNTTLDWQSLNVSSATGRKIVSSPCIWQSADGSVTHLAAQGADGALLLFSVARSLREVTDALSAPFASMAPARGKTGKLLVIFWMPTGMPLTELPRSAVEQAFVGKTNSVKSYYEENSGGAYSIDVAAFLPRKEQGQSEWYPSAYPGAYYWQLNGEKVHDGWLSTHAEKYAEAITRAGKDFDYSQYDANHDKVLSTDELRVCLIMPAGKDGGTSGYVRPVVGKEVPQEPLIVDGVQIPEIFECYLANPPHIGLICHETAHSMIGAPDEYTASPWGYYYTPYTPGIYSLMDAAVGHLDPFCKLKSGWLRPQIVLRSGRYTIPSVERTGVAYILTDAKHGADEFFVVENRSGYGADSFLPMKGLAVWQVILKGYQTLPPPPFTDPKSWQEVDPEDWGRRALRLIHPKGGPPGTVDLNARALWNNRVGYDLTSDDPDPTHGSLRWSDGTPSGFALRRISRPGDTITVEITAPGG
jgi:M6 family metalloprotease-like protein